MPIGAANSSSRRGTNGKVSCGTVESDGGPWPAVRVVRLVTKVTEPVLHKRPVRLYYPPPQGEPDGEAAGSLRFGRSTIA